MTLTRLAKQGEKFVADNSPAILTGMGVVGVVSTALLTGKATFKAAELIREREFGDNADRVNVLETKDRALLVWRLYIPAASTGLLTATAIIGANRIGTRRAAVMAAAYSMSEKAFTEYKDKVVEKIGENKERDIRDSVAQDRVARNPVDNQQVIVTGGGEVLCYDTWTGRYFQSSMEALKKAQNDVNYQVLNNYYASLSDFYDKVGLSRTKNSDDFGWNSDDLLELYFSTTMSDDDRPCISVDFRVEPIRGYSRVH